MSYVQVKKVQAAADTQGAIATTVATSKTVAQTVATNTATAATVGLKLATIALQGVLTLGLSAAITFIVTAFTKLSSSAKDTTKDMVDMANKTQEVYDDLRSSLETNADGKALIKQYEELTDQVATLKKELENNSLSAEDLDVKTGELSAAQNDLVTIQEKLIEMYPQASKSIDDQGKLVFGQIQDYKDLTEAEDEYYKLKLKILELEARANRDNVAEEITQNERQIKAYQWQFEQKMKNLDNYDPNSDVYRKIADSANELLEENIRPLIETNRELEKQLATYDAVINQADASQYELIVSTNKLTDAQDDLTNSTDDLSDSQQNTKKSAEELAAENKEAAETYLEVTENIQKVQEWLEKIESGKFDLSDAQSMLGVLDGFTGDITNIDDVYANLKNQLQDLVQAQGEAYAEMRYQDEEFWSQKYKGSDDWVNYVAAAEQDIISIVSNSLGVQGQDFINYIDDMGGFRDVDLSNVKNLAEAKGAVEGGLVEQLKQMWAEYYKAQSAIISDAVRQDVLKNSPNASIGKVMAMEQEAMAELNKQNEIITNLLNNVNTNVKPTYSGGAGQTYLNRNPSSSSSSSSSKSNEVADLDLQIDRYHDLEREITRVNNALTANKAAQQHATPTEKVKLMREELKLYQELQKAQSNLMTEQKKELAELRKTLTQNGFTFNSDGTISNYQRHLQQLQNSANSLAGDAKANKIEAVKGIKEIADAYEQLINETIPSTQNAYKELTNTIRETQKQQLQYIADIQSQITDALTEELQKRNDAVKSALEKEKELYNKQYDEDNWNDEFNQEKQKLAEIQAQIDALSRDFSEAGRLKLEQLMEEYREQQEAIDKMLQDKMHEEGNSRYDEAIEELDKELEDLLTPESLASMVSEALEKGFISLNGEVIKTENLLTEMLKNSGDLFLATGQLIQSELIDGLKVAQSLMSDIAKLNSSYLGSARSMTMDTSTYTLTPNVNTRSIDTRGMATSTPSVTVSFDQLLNVEGNLDTSLMLDLETKLRQAMDEVTRSISQALTYR